MSNELEPMEKIIEYLNSKFEDPQNSTNEIRISKTDATNLDMDEKCIVKYLLLMESSKIIAIKNRSTHDNLNKFWTIYITNSCVNYFDNKEKSELEQKRIHREEVRSNIALVIAVLAFIISVYALYLEFFPKQNAYVETQQSQNPYTHTYSFQLKHYQ